jgi:tRNA wybutosine-synthesizing protein 3
MFDRLKAAIKYKEDRSKKGSVDIEIVRLLDIINAHPDLYTTSSCSGRITLMVETEARKKDEAEWLYVTHDRASRDLLEALKEVPQEHTTLRMEPFIVHVCARDLEVASRVLKAAVAAGCKHSGIIAVKRRIVIELTGNEALLVPVADQGRLLVSDDYLAFIMQEANRKLAKNHATIRRLEHEFRSV